VSSEATSVAHETVNALFNKIIGPFAATQVVPLLIEPANIEDRVSVLVNEFNAHPTLLPPFTKLIAGMQKKEVVASTEEQIRFFQSTQTRNYLFVNLLNEVLQVKELKLDTETGRLPNKPNELLKFSHTARVEFGEESRYKDLMCTIGLLFDFVFYLQKTPILNLNGAKFDEFIRLCFKNGVDQGKLVIRLCRHKPKLTNEKLAPVIPLLRQLSQVIFCLLYPTIGPEFYKKLSTIKYTEPLRLALEMKEFGVHSGILSAYIAQTFDIFDPLGEVMSVWGQPYVANYTKNKPNHDLAAIAELGVILKESFKVVDFSATSNVGFTVPELKFLDFTLSPSVREDLTSEGKSG
jgi:hypothetical protein